MRTRKRTILKIIQIEARDRACLGGLAEEAAKAEDPQKALVDALEHYGFRSRRTVAYAKGQLDARIGV